MATGHGSQATERGRQIQPTSIIPSRRLASLFSFSAFRLSRNGPKWTDIVAKVLDLELINFATGGATTDNAFAAGGTGASSAIPVPSADDQITAFLSQYRPRPTDIFVLWIGANDILFNTTTAGTQVTSLISGQVNRLYLAGIKRLVLANYNNATTFPATYNSSDYNVPSVQAYVGDLTIGLKNTAAGYSAFLQTAFVDSGALLLDIMERPAKYNIDQTYVDPPTACLTGVYSSEGVPRHVCNDPERHLFFDSYHPVKEVHAMMAKMFIKAIQGFSHWR